MEPGLGVSDGGGAHDPGAEAGSTALTRVLEVLAAVERRLEGIESSLRTAIDQRVIRDWYDTAAVAELLGKAEFTVREWCRRGRIRAQKRRSGRGKYQLWVISHEELQRFQREGLLPED